MRAREFSMADKANFRKKLDIPSTPEPFEVLILPIASLISCNPIGLSSNIRFPGFSWYSPDRRGLGVSPISTARAFPTEQNTCSQYRKFLSYCKYSCHLVSRDQYQQTWIVYSSTDLRFSKSLSFHLGNFEFSS